MDEKLKHSERLAKLEHDIETVILDYIKDTGLVPDIIEFDDSYLKRFETIIYPAVRVRVRRP